MRGSACNASASRAAPGPLRGGRFARPFTTRRLLDEHPTARRTALNDATLRRATRLVTALVTAAAVWVAGNALFASQPAVAIAAAVVAVIALVVWRRTRPSSA